MVDFINQLRRGGMEKKDAFTDRKNETPSDSL